jgi:nucleotide-binding universal stress UspA family protein
VAVPVSPKARIEASQKEEAAVRAYLESAAKLIRAKGLKVDAVTLQGPVGETIVSYAKENKIDLIALATHGRSGVGRAVLGSIADYVVKESGLPTLIFRPKKEA